MFNKMVNKKFVYVELQLTVQRWGYGNTDNKSSSICSRIKTFAND